jgi:nucleotide-binding universal stress UspA family protein
VSIGISVELAPVSADCFLCLNRPRLAKFVALCRGLLGTDQQLGRGMHRHILLPTDGSELSQKAIDYGMALAKSVNAKVMVLTVSPPFHAFAVEPGIVIDTPEQYGKRMAVLTAKYLNVAKEAALAAGVSCDTMHVEHDQPYLAIIEAAAQKSCDLIVMASHGRRGISAIVLGSEAVKVLTHSTIPVLVFRVPRPPFVFAS